MTWRIRCPVVAVTMPPWPDDEEAALVDGYGGVVLAV